MRIWELFRNPRSKRYMWTVAYKTGRKFVIALCGGTIALFGVLLLLTPGPGMLVIPIGLAILGLEFAWARRWLRHLKQHAESAVNKIRRKNA